MPLQHEELTGAIIGAAIEVHTILGPGFVESIYEEAFSIELKSRDIPFRRQLRAPVFYRGVEVGLHRLDLFVVDRIVVELKTVKNLERVHFVIVRSCLLAIDREHGLLLNFGNLTLGIKRVSGRARGFVC